MRCFFGRARELEGVADEPLRSGPREAHLGQDLLAGGAGEPGPAVLGVDVLGVLADDDEVDLLSALALQGRHPIVVEHDRPEVDVQVEAPAHPDDDFALGDAARGVRVPDGAEEDRLVGPELVEHLRRDVAPGVVDVDAAGKGYGHPVGAEAEAALGGIEDDQSGLADLGADPVASQHAQPVGLPHGADPRIE